MRRSEIDKRAKRYAPKQSVSDYGMHKDARPPKATKMNVADEQVPISPRPMKAT